MVDQAGRLSTGVESRLDLDHFEIGFAHVAIRADPVFGYIFPTRAGRDAFLGETLGFVVNEITGEASPAFGAVLLLFRCKEHDRSLF